MRAKQQEGYDEEELLCMHVTPDKETQEDYELEPESWQISCLVQWAQKPLQCLRVLA